MIPIACTLIVVAQNRLGKDDDRNVMKLLEAAIVLLELEQSAERRRRELNA